MIQEHADAMLALARATLTVHDGPAPDGATPPYVVVYFADTDPELAESRPLTGASERHVVRATAHCVGGNQKAARIVADKLRTAWLDQVPTIAGRQCWPIRREEGIPADPDETTGSLIVDQVEVYRLESVPA